MNLLLSLYNYFDMLAPGKRLCETFQNKVKWKVDPKTSNI